MQQKRCSLLQLRGRTSYDWVSEFTEVVQFLTLLTHMKQQQIFNTACSFFLWSSASFHVTRNSRRTYSFHTVEGHFPLVVFMRSDRDCNTCLPERPARLSPSDWWRHLTISGLISRPRRRATRQSSTSLCFNCLSPGRSAQRYSFFCPAPLAGCEPVTLTFGLLSPWVAGCRLRLPAAVLSRLWVNAGKKKRNGNIVTRSAETKVLLARIILWALTHNCKGLWEIGTFHCFCSNHLFICLPFSPSCPYSSFCLSSLSSPICSFFSRSSLSSCSPLRPCHPSLPILIISHFDFSLRVPLFLLFIRLSHLLILTVIPRFLS